MITLKGDGMTVSVLHPVEEAHLLGTRYCTGGFGFQIDDDRHGPLLSGPPYPDSYNLFDGQGIPDAFQPHLPLAGGSLLGIGIGRIDPARNEVAERCLWRIQASTAGLSFGTSQAGDEYAFTLERALTVAGRTLTSATGLANSGKRHIPFQWYPHPFYPHYPGGECCKLDSATLIPENPGFERAPSGFLRMRGHPWVGRSHFVIVGYPAATRVTVLQKHPRLALVAARCDYATTRFPIWGNDRTFSFVPYYERVVSPGEEASWSVTYDF